MVRILYSILLILLLSTSPALAVNKNFSLFAGTGVGYSWPKVFRIGWKEVEVGQYTNSLSVVKNFTKGDYYLGFGGGLALQGTADLGVTGSAGWEKIWKFIGLRLDWTTFAATSSYMSTEVTVGLTLTF